MFEILCINWFSRKICSAETNGYVFLFLVHSYFICIGKKNSTTAIKTATCTLLDNRCPAKSRIH